MIGHFAWRARSGRHPQTGFLLPATVDPRIQKDLLRDELGFRGLILTDAIPMGGLQSHFSHEAQYVVFSAPDPRQGHIRLGRAAMDALDWPRIYSGFPVYFVSFGSPYVVWELGAIRNFVCCYSKQPQIVEAYVRALLGEIPFQGELPVELPDQ